MGGCMGGDVGEGVVEGTEDACWWEVGLLELCAGMLLSSISHLSSM